MSEPESTSTMPEVEEEKNKECSHYKRWCKLVCPTCTKPYVCRLCHDEEEEDHKLDRFAVTSLVCRVCDTKQPKARDCRECGTRFGKYSCLVCSLFDDIDHEQYHCSDCGLCRVGGRTNYKHCDTCGCCLPVTIEHKCLDDASARVCPVCLEDVHSSRVPAHMPPCHHLLHTTCFQDMIRKGGQSACPTCGKSMIDMTKVWAEQDIVVAETPMPAVYSGVCCQMLCKDCNKETISTYHIVGLKCKLCGSYNTTRSGGSLIRKKQVTGSLATEQPTAAQTVTMQSPQFAPTETAEAVFSRVAQLAGIDYSVLTTVTSQIIASNTAAAVSNAGSSRLRTGGSSGDDEASASGINAPSTSSQTSGEVDSNAPSTSSQEASVVNSNAPSTSSQEASVVDSNALATSSREANGVGSNAPSTSTQASGVVGSASAAAHGLTAAEEIHLYEPVDAVEIESQIPESEVIELNPDNLMRGFMRNVTNGLNRVLEFLESDDFQNEGDLDNFMASLVPIRDGIVSVRIDNREAEAGEEDNSEWETDDDNNTTQ